jgi:sporulation-control protein spo0M
MQKPLLSNQSLFAALLKFNLNDQQTSLSFFKKSLSFVAAIGVTKYTTILATQLVTLCCAPKVFLRCLTNVHA